MKDTYGRNIVTQGRDIQKGHTVHTRREIHTKGHVHEGTYKYKRRGHTLTVWSIDRQDRPEYSVGLSTENLELVCLSSRQGLSIRPLGKSGWKNPRKRLTGQKNRMSEGVRSKFASTLSQPQKK